MKNNMFKSIVEVNRGTAKKETIADSSTALREEDLTLAFRDNTASQLAAARTRRGETKETPSERGAFDDLWRSAGLAGRH